MCLPEENPGAVRIPPIPAMTVADVSAESRGVVLEAIRGVECGGSVLVLAPDTESQERLQAALRRNGVPVADDDATPLGRHSLVSVLAPFVPLFGARGEGLLEGLDLQRLFTDPVLSRRSPSRANPEDSEEDTGQRGPTRQVREILASIRRARGTLEQWIAGVERARASAAVELEGLSEDESKRPVVALKVSSAEVLSAQLTLLAAKARGHGKLRDLAEFVDGIGLSDPGGDRLGRAVIRALFTEGHRPASIEDFEDALAGSLGSGRVDQGVQVLAYDAYDGRPSDLLLLSGVHQKGLGRVRAHDPLLSDRDAEVLGIPSASTELEERLALARWAVSRSGRALAFVARTDSSGRAVSPPVDLELAVDERYRNATHGQEFDLPESRDLEVLGGQGDSDPLTRQVDAEWARRGASFQGEGASLQSESAGPALPDQLRRDLPRIPKDLLPFMGATGPYLGAGGSGLPPDFVLSASRLNKFTSCLFSAFCDSVLRLRVPEDVTEELDPKEVGKAIHRALERALVGEKLLVPRALLEQRREALANKLAACTRAAVDEQALPLPDGPGALPLSLAREGLAARWTANWRSWVDARIEAVEDFTEEAGKLAVDSIDKVFVDDAVEALAPPGPEGEPAKESSEGAGIGSDQMGGNVDAFLGSRDDIVTSVARTHQSHVGAALDGNAARGAIERLCREASVVLGASSFDPSGDLEVIRGELAFGTMPRDLSAGKPLTLELGGQALSVRGSIDVVLRRKGPGASATPGLEVRDYKTGAKSGTPADLVENLTRPQLAFYALVLENAAREILGLENPGHVERIALDYVKKNELVASDVSTDVLVSVRKGLGEVLDLARSGLFPPLPQADTCPLLKSRGAYCDFSDVCRLRRNYTAEPATRKGSHEHATRPTRSPGPGGHGAGRFRQDKAAPLPLLAAPSDVDHRSNRCDHIHSQGRRRTRGSARVHTSSRSQSVVGDRRDLAPVPEPVSGRPPVSGASACGARRSWYGAREHGRLLHALSCPGVRARRAPPPLGRAEGLYRPSGHQRGKRDEPLRSCGT